MSINSNSELRISGNIPIDIQVEIIKHLPIKSLIRCTLLSKLHNGIIKSPSFITEHSVRQNQQHHLLAWYETHEIGTRNESQNYVSIIDNDIFPQNYSRITTPDILNQIYLERDYVESSGLLCFTVGSRSVTNVNKCYIWNPSIRRCITIPIPNGFGCVVGFGVCPKSNDPKLVKIRASATCISANWDAEIYSDNILS
ncbi:putative F-box protein At1g47790 [Rutidosis leptorrhynchoides]|uniref:putative F-box protein At1g47790 n=1 Tax=Rutidosis leptorrhynchoides TaxID=125765 RepID=UPI003A99C3AF